MHGSAFFLAAMAVVVGCGANSQSSPASLPRMLQVDTAPGVTIEVADWGGSGRALLLLAGGGHTARVYDDFAPLLTDEYRVIGVTRRGGGTSSDVSPDSLDELVDDLVVVLNEFDLDSAILVGHSFAGMEMALFGEQHSERCEGLIYLDAAYDYTNPELGRIFETTPPPQAPPMTAADSASVGAVRAYVERVSNFSLPEEEILATRRFDAAGKLSPNPPSDARRRIASLQRAPRWNAVDCSSLGIYAIPAPPETWLPYYHELDEPQRQGAASYLEAYGRWTAAQRAEFGRWPQNKVIEFPSSNHYFFLEQPEEAARHIKEFIVGLS